MPSETANNQETEWANQNRAQVAAMQRATLPFMMAQAATQEQQAEESRQQTAITRQQVRDFLLLQGDGMGDSDYDAEAKRLQKRYTMRMDWLKLDLTSEEQGIKSPWFYPIGVATYGMTDVASFFDGGMFTTILNWIVYIGTTVVIVVRLYRYSAIRYSNPDRQIRRVRRLGERAVKRCVIRLAISALEAVPLVGFLPIWSGVHSLEKLWEMDDADKLHNLRAKQEKREKQIEKLWQRAKDGMGRYKVAAFGTRVMNRLEQDFDEL